MMISTLDKVIYYKGTFYRAQWNLSLQYKIGWRPAEKNCRFFQHASSSTKIFMISSQNSEKNKKRKLCLNESFWVLLDQNLRCSVGNWLWIIIQGCRMVYFQTKNPIWINFGGSCNRTSCYILWPLGLFYKYLVYFMVIWYVFGGIFVPVLVWCIKKNLATLRPIVYRQMAKDIFYSYVCIKFPTFLRWPKGQIRFFFSWAGMW
jgi:hypothetical protein